MFFRLKKSGERAYVQIVENKRVDGAVRQSVQYHGADWMVRTDAARTIAALFRQAHVALPPRARQTAPRRSPRPPQNPPQNAEAAPSIVPRRLESRRKLMKIRGLLKLGV